MFNRPALLFPLIGVGLTAAPAQAQDDFYRGKTVNIVVGFTPGGGYDVNARAVAPHHDKYPPGNLSLIVQSVRAPGSLTWVRAPEAPAPKDGRAVTVFNPGLV